MVLYFIAKGDKVVDSCFIYAREEKRDTASEKETAIDGLSPQDFLPYSGHFYSRTSCYPVKSAKAPH